MVQLVKKKIGATPNPSGYRPLYVRACPHKVALVQMLIQLAFNPRLLYGDENQVAAYTI